MSPSQQTPVWDVAAPPETLAPLREDLRADVCVVGAGIAGISTAYELARAGRSVVVLDAHGIAAGQTGLTTAHLASAMDDRFSNLESMHGVEGSRLAYRSNQAAVDRIGELAREEGIDCDYQRLDGYLFLTPGDSPELLQRELDAADRAGFAGVELLQRIPGAPFDSGPCLRFPHQARVHPTRYVQGLAHAVLRRGGRIFTGTHVAEVRSGPDVGVRTREGHTVSAGAVVVATNSPIQDRVRIHTKQAPYLTYAIGARVPEAAVPDALIWDSGDPYHYVRLQPVERDGERHWVLIVGGEDHHSGHDYRGGERHDRLEAWTRERFPIAEVEFRWSGQVFEPVDYVAFIGRNPGDDHVYVVTGDSGQGMTHGAAAGMLISDLIQGRENPWARLYDPGRKTLRAAGEFLRTNLEVAGSYAEWLTGTGQEVSSPESLAPGAGAVYRRPGGMPVAVYRDEQGALHERSAVCTHLGCIVHWNDVASTWDCPCHGSRYTPQGEVVNGPAPRALDTVEDRA